MTIREAETKDALDLSNLLGQLGYPSSEDSSLEKINVYSQLGYKMLMMEMEGKVTGFISLHWYLTPHLPGATGRITAFCMDEKVRGQGLGTRLLEVAEQHFKNFGCFKIEVTSNSKRTQTHRYYLNLGYQETSRHFVKFLKEF